jgi:hypothetical protein
MADHFTSTGSNTFVFTHPLSGSPASDITATYRWSKDLVNFQDNGIADGEGTMVSFQQGTPSNGMVTVTATITGTPASRVFVDVRVSQSLP